MNKPFIRILVIASIPLGGFGAMLIVLGLMGSIFDQTTRVMVHLANPPLFVSGVCIAVLAALTLLSAWIGALIRAIRLGQWPWVVLLVALQGPATLLYSIVGPEEEQNGRGTNFA